MAQTRFGISISFFCLLAIYGCGVREPEPLSLQQSLVREQRVQGLLDEATVGLREGSETSLLRASAALRLAEELAPDDPRVADGLGCVAFRFDHLELAKTYFQRALQLNPDYDRPYAHLASVAEAEGEKHAAVYLLHEALRRNPLNVRARNNLAALLFEFSERNSSDERVRGQATVEIEKAAWSVRRRDKTLLRNLELFGNSAVAVTR